MTLAGSVPELIDPADPSEIASRCVLAVADSAARTVAAAGV